MPAPRFWMGQGPQRSNLQHLWLGIDRFAASYPSNRQTEINCSSRDLVLCHAGVFSLSGNNRVSEIALIREFLGPLGLSVIRKSSILSPEFIN